MIMQSIVWVIASSIETGKTDIYSIRTILLGVNTELNLKKMAGVGCRPDCQSIVYIPLCARLDLDEAL